MSCLVKAVTKDPLEVTCVPSLPVQHAMHDVAVLMNYTLIQEFGVTFLFFSKLPSHGHLHSKTSLAAQQSSTLHCRCVDGRMGGRY